jgi:hypothetical protein
MDDASLRRRHQSSSISAQEPTKPPKTYWTDSTTLVTDGRRVLLTIENTCKVWFPGGKQETEDAAPECTTTRALTETTGFKVSETNLRLSGTESSGQNKRYVYIARVRPGSIPNATSTSRAVWATSTELISGGRTG